jgi:hypothetical protein
MILLFGKTLLETPCWKIYAPSKFLHLSRVPGHDDLGKETPVIGSGRRFTSLLPVKLD